MICFVTKIENKIYIPQSLRQQNGVLSWYHEYLLHQQQTRTENTIRYTMILPGLTQDVDKEGATTQETCAAPTQNCRTLPLDHSMYASGGFIYNKETF
jgi:hypothetical protein